MSLAEKFPSQDNPEKFPVDERGFYQRTPEEEILEEREVVDKKEFSGGVNEVFTIALKDDGRAIFKPKKGEKRRLRPGIEAGSYYLRERAAYLADRFLGFGLIPPTVIRKVDGEVGSAQAHVYDAAASADVSWDEFDPEARAQIIKLWILDVLIFNRDRHDGNIIIRGNKLFAIDNGLAFGNGGQLITYRNCFGERIPRDVVDRLKELCGRDDLRTAMHSLLSELLDKTDVDAFFTRLERLTGLIEDDKISEMDEDELELFN